jgi:probable HAF family extracellular repeat protein
MRASLWFGLLSILMLQGAIAAQPRYTIQAVPTKEEWNSEAHAMAGHFVGGVAVARTGLAFETLLASPDKVRQRQPFDEAISVVKSANASGTTTGYAGDHAFLAPAKGKAQRLFPDGFDAFSVAEGINDSGVVVGYHTASISAMPQAFVWTQGVVESIPPLQAGWSGWARAINAHGVIVGVSSPKSGVSHAFIHRDGATFELPGLTEWGAEAFGLNNAGWAVGFAKVDGGMYGRPVLWRDGEVINLGAVGDIPGTAHGVNMHGVVVGVRHTQNIGERRGWVWMDGHLSALDGLVDGLPPNTAVLAADAIDDHGRIAVTLGGWNKADHAFHTTAAVLVPKRVRD